MVQENPHPRRDVLEFAQFQSSAECSRWLHRYVTITYHTHSSVLFCQIAMSCTFIAYAVVNEIHTYIIKEIPIKSVETSSECYNISIKLISFPL